MAVSGAGDVVRCFDTFTDGDYDICYHFSNANTAKGREPLTSSSRYEARPSIAYDPAGRLWIAYEEGPELGGKDYGALDAGDGEPLYASRSVRVVCLESGKLMRPVAELPTSDVKKPNQVGGAGQPGRDYSGTRYAYPKVIDCGPESSTAVVRHAPSSIPALPADVRPPARRRPLDQPIELHHPDGLLRICRCCCRTRTAASVVHYRRPLHYAQQDRQRHLSEPRRLPGEPACRSCPRSRQENESSCSAQRRWRRSSASAISRRADGKKYWLSAGVPLGQRDFWDGRSGRSKTCSATRSTR